MAMASEEKRQGGSLRPRNQSVPSYRPTQNDSIFTSAAQIPDGLVHDLCEIDRIFVGRPIPILHDARLRECDYGNFEGRPSTEMELPRAAAIRVPFPHGESYEQIGVRMRSFLEELAAERDGEQVLPIAHSATLWMLEHWLRDAPVEAAVGMFPERSCRFALEPQHWHTSQGACAWPCAVKRP